MGILRGVLGRATIGAFVGALLLALATPAWADGDAVARAREEARALADKGYAEMQRGHFDAAIELFAKAEAKFHAPTILLMMAEAQVKAQKLIEAKTTYERIASESLVNYAPQEFFEAQKKARAAATSLVTRIPRLTIRVTGAPPEKANVTLDGKPVPVEFIGKAIAANPGQHVVSHRAEGMQLASVSILLKEKADEKLTLALVPEASSPEPTPPPLAQTPPTPPPLPPPAPPAEDLDPQLPGYAMLGVGGLGLVVGAATGILTLSKAGDIKDQCRGDVCPTGLVDDASDARTFGTVSTVSFAVAGALLAGGGVWLALDPLGEAAPTSDAAGAPRLLVGLGGLAVCGEF